MHWNNLVITIIILVLLTPSILFAGEIHGSFELGSLIIHRKAFSKIDISYNFNIWKFENQIYGGWETGFILPQYGIIMEKILYDIYLIGLKTKVKNIYFKAEHECKHMEDDKKWRDNYSKTILVIGIEW